MIDLTLLHVRILKLKSSMLELYRGSLKCVQGSIFSYRIVKHPKMFSCKLRYEISISMKSEVPCWTSASVLFDDEKPNTKRTDLSKFSGLRPILALEFRLHSPISFYYTHICAVCISMYRYIFIVLQEFLLVYFIERFMEFISRISIWIINRFLAIDIFMKSIFIKKYKLKIFLLYK